MPLLHLPRRVRIALLIMSVATVYATAEFLHTLLQFSLMNEKASVWRVLYGEFSFAYLWAAVSPAVLWVGRRFRLARPHIVRNGAVQIASAVFFMLSVRLLWEVVGGPLKSFYDGGVNVKKALYAITANYEYALFAYLMILVAGYAWEYNKRYRDESVRAARLRTEMVQAQLQAIKMQIHPHFLFNTLHSISALIQVSPDAAERMIARLSDLLRLTLDLGRVPEIRLEEELRLVRLYLEIEQTRYEDRLQAEFAIAPDVRDAAVPNFILQPLIENAVKYGIAPSARPGRITVSAQRDFDQLILRVRNTGPCLPRTTLREGVGLAATRSRLEFLYGEKQRFSLRDLTTGEVEASIILPFATFDSRRGENGDHPNPDRGRRETGAREAAPALDARA